MVTKNVRNKSCIPTLSIFKKLLLFDSKKKEVEISLLIFVNFGPVES